MRASKLLGFGALVVLSLVAAGCGKSERVPVHKARGTVLFNGRPVPHALLVLRPTASDPKAPRPRATVKDDGTFDLTTYDAGDGAPAGEYAVTVQWFRTSATKATREGDEPPPRNLLPARYARAETSGLRVRIQEGENNLPPLNLKK